MTGVSLRGATSCMAIWDYNGIILPRGVLSTSQVHDSSPSLGGATPPLSHAANGLYDVGLTFSMRNG